MKWFNRLKRWWPVRLLLQLAGGRVRSKRRRPTGPLPWQRIIAPMVGLAIASLIAGAAFAAIGWYVNSSPYFRLERIEVVGDVPPESRASLSQLPVKPRTQVFDVDLAHLRDWLRVAHPEFLQIDLIRRLPNTLVIEVKTRHPKARLGYGVELLCVDEAGMIFPNVTDPRYRKVPLISGFDPLIVRLKVGEVTRSISVHRALALLEALQGSGLIERLTLERIDASDYKNLSVVFVGWPEVKMGHEAFEERLGRFELLVPTIEPRKAGIQYVDVRFEDPIMKPR